MASSDKAPLFSSLSRLKRLSDSNYTSRYAAPSSRSTETEQELEELILELRSKVKEQEDALKKLRSQASTKPLREPSTKTQIAHQKTRTTTLTEPHPTLDTITAISLLHNTTSSLTKSLSTATNSRIQLQTLLDAETALLKETEELNVALRNHYAELQETQKELGRAGSKVHAEKEREVREKAVATRKEAGFLLRELRDFIERILSLMVSAEDAGGPVVGEQLDVEMLKYIVATAKKKAGKKGQPTIAQMWGVGEDPEEEDPTTQFKTLLEAIMNAASEPMGSPYVEIRRESAASRFLVRTGIARFHPRDARKLKLVDFGRTLEDG